MDQPLLSTAGPEEAGDTAESDNNDDAVENDNDPSAEEEAKASVDQEATYVHPRQRFSNIGIDSCSDFKHNKYFPNPK